MQEVKNRTGADSDIMTYRWAGFTLTAGMYASLGAMVGGLIWWLLAGAPGGTASASTTIPLDRIVSELLAFNPLALLNLGVLLLLATPGITLIAEIATYAAARNWRYAGIAALVGTILLLSLVLSLGWIKV